MRGDAGNRGSGRGSIGENSWYAADVGQTDGEQRAAGMVCG
jgi:hypothetical protein